MLTLARPGAWLPRSTTAKDHTPDILRSSFMAHVNRVEAYSASGLSTGHSLNGLFVGGPGTGKSWTISRLCEAMYGSCCNTCRLKIAFEDASNKGETAAEARRRQREEAAAHRRAVEEHLKSYKFGMVELDDVHYAPPGALNFLCEFAREGSVASHAMILMSLNDQNSKDIITKFMFDKSRYLDRDEIDSDDVAEYLLPAVENLLLSSKSSLAKCMVRNGLVDATVPFLPMDRDCVRQCEERQLLELARDAVDKGLYKSLAVDRALAEHIATSVVQYEPASEYGKGHVFAKSGCRFKDKGKPGVFCANQLSDHRHGSPKIERSFWPDYYEHYDRDAQLTLKAKKSGKYQCTRKLFRRAVTEL